jgi:hypothetical protein
MAIVRDYSISDYFKQQQHRNYIDQAHQQIPGKFLPEKIIDSECSSINATVFCDYLYCSAALFISDSEFSQLTFRKILIWRNGELVAAIDPVEEFGGPGADAAITVKEQIIVSSLDHISVCSVFSLCSVISFHSIRCSALQTPRTASVLGAARTV